MRTINFEKCKQLLVRSLLIGRRKQWHVILPIVFVLFGVRETHHWWLLFWAVRFHIIYDGLNGVNRQPSNGLKFNCQVLGGSQARIQDKYWPISWERAPKAQGSSGMQGHGPYKSADFSISRFQLGEIFHIKNIFIMKTLTDFRKTVETCVDPRLVALPHKRLMGMCRWMGSHFHDWIDYNGVAFSIELLGLTFSDFLS